MQNISSQILGVLFNGETMTAADLDSRIGAGLPQVLKALARLRDRGHVKRIGKVRPFRWEITPTGERKAI